MNTFLQMLLNQQGGAQALPNSFVDAVANGQGWGKLAPISQVPMSEDDAGNQYAANGSIIRKGIAPGSMTWGETALAGATAPAKFATGLASTLSPYGSEGFQVPPILAEPVRAGNRLLNSGGFPDPQDPQNQQDAVTSLLAFFGANALKGTGVAAKGAASAPGAAALSLGDYGQAAYRAARYSGEKSISDRPASSLLNDFGIGPTVGNDLQNFGFYTDRNGTVLKNYPGIGEDTFGAFSGPNRRANDATPVPMRLETVDELFSDTSRPSVMGSAVGSSDKNYIYHGTKNENMESIRRNGLRPNEWGNPLNFHFFQESADDYRYPLKNDVYDKTVEPGPLFRVPVESLPKDSVVHYPTVRTQSVVAPELLEVFDGKDWVSFLSDTSRPSLLGSAVAAEQAPNEAGILEALMSMWRNK